MSKGLTVGAVLPDFELPDDTGTMRRLSELQGDDALVLQLGRGEHCPRERQHHKELLPLQELLPVAFTQLVTVLPNDQHDTNKMRIATGAWWPFLSDADLVVQRTLEIDEYTDTHHAATVPHTLVLSSPRRPASIIGGTSVSTRSPGGCAQTGIPPASATTRTAPTGSRRWVGTKAELSSPIRESNAS
jgi:peroxiredoxin